MDLTVPRELDAPTVISDEVGGETLAINLGTGAYFVIAPSTGPVWNALASGVPGALLLDGDDDPRAAALTAFVGKVVDAGLLRDAATAADAEGAAAWTAEDLLIEEHTDMADLLGLDPIHDADAHVGWPMRRTHD